MAAEPNKTEILTIFKRLRSITTNKVTRISPYCLFTNLMIRYWRWNVDQKNDDVHPSTVVSWSLPGPYDGQQEADVSSLG